MVGSMDLENILKKKKILDNTVIIITSDHGQSIKENNFYGHGIFLYEELIHIPMLMKLPKNISNYPDSSSCINLVDIHNFIKAVVAGDINPTKFLEKDHTFSEAFGLQYSKEKLKNYTKTKDASMAYERLNIPRKAIISPDCKLTLNSNSDVEEYFSGNLGKDHDLTKVRDFIFKLSIFNLDKDFKIDEEQIIVAIGEKHEQKV